MALPRGLLRLRHAAVALTGRARTEYRAYVSTLEEELTWELLQEFFRLHFGSKNPALHWNKQLMSIKQGTHENVTAYCSRFRRTLSHSSP